MCVADIIIELAKISLIRYSYLIARTDDGEDILSTPDDLN